MEMQSIIPHVLPQQHARHPNFQIHFGTKGVNDCLAIWIIFSEMQQHQANGVQRNCQFELTVLYDQGQMENGVHKGSSLLRVAPHPQKWVE
ncbi:hypothetical protein GX51_05773 [Blastomyces parvus]|uniref:Uncharacterized protein n=1 Tax=Blastomyces parvus TaxID=2060905 RepID=A0A2B7WUV8_9EURO|nr:hypothetical protein GX51_05773 [Blastomyces parvus]